MKNLIIAIITFFALFQATNAQTLNNVLNETSKLAKALTTRDTTPFPKNNVKLYLLTLPLGEFKVGYERFLTRKVAVNAQISYTNNLAWKAKYTKTIQPIIHRQIESQPNTKMIESNSSITGFSISPEIRYYRSKKNKPRPAGSYAGLYFTYRLTHISINGTFTQSDQLYQANATMNNHALGFGTLWGKQWVLKSFTEKTKLVGDFTFHFGMDKNSTTEPSVSFANNKKPEGFNESILSSTSAYKIVNFEKKSTSISMGINFGLGISF